MKDLPLRIFICCGGFGLILSQSSTFFPTINNVCNTTPDNCANPANIQCLDIRYRTLDGSCNNPSNPSLGMAMTSYRRLLPARYSDGISWEPLALSGNELPSARLLSFRVFGRETLLDPDYTLLNMQWGQFIAHDTSLRLSDTSQGIRPMDVTQQVCCNSAGRYILRNTSANCLPISVPFDDPFFIGIECIDFRRTVTDRDQKCPGANNQSPVNQLSGSSHFIDLSLVYGNSIQENRNLRTLRGGLMKTSDVSETWPPKFTPAESTCSPTSPNGVCYVLGDFRGNQSPGLVSLHIIFLREHNRIAKELARINPGWDDDLLFQEARKINIAQYQHITYYEWLANSYDNDMLRQHGLLHGVQPTEYVSDYDRCVDPRGLQSFQHSSFRYFHNQIIGMLQLVAENRQVLNDSIPLLDVLNRPGLLEQNNQYGSFIRGLTTQSSKFGDRNFDMAAADHFQFSGPGFSQDLRSIDLQRDRDHGLASYNDFRALCGLRRARSFEDFGDYISARDIRTLRSLYESHEDVDLSIGAAMERYVSGALVGPTYLCINLYQFWSFRAGDRYWYENANQPNPFTRAQLVEIRKASASRLFCDHGDVRQMQTVAFRKIARFNALNNCASIPRVNLERWRA